jgi:hypothetical protein
MAYNKAYNVSRKAEGKCIDCDNPPYNDTYRCLHHTLANRLRAAEWKARNNKHKLELDWLRRRILIAGGACYCKTREPLKPGYVKCDKCLERHQKQQQKYQRYWQKLQTKYEAGQLDTFTGHRPARINAKYQK